MKLVDPRGNEFWHQDGVYHREDGPAIIYTDGTKCWILNGKRHREDGPAIEFADGTKEWWFYHGQKIEVSSTEEFLRIIKLKAFW